MKKFFSSLPKSLVIAAIAVVAITTAAFAYTHYTMNQTVVVNYTVTQTVTQGTVSLASDLLGTPLGNTLTLASVAEGGTPQGAVYFDASKIDPSTIAVNATGVTNGTVGWIVGTPSQSTHFCPIAIYITGPVAPGGSFSLTVTGNSIP